MLTILSLIFIILQIMQLEADTITSVQALINSIFGLIVFYQSSKKYWKKEGE